MTRPIDRIEASDIEAGLTVQDRVELQESDLRKNVAQKITFAFIVVNLGVLVLVFLAAVLDHCFIANQMIKGGERLVTTNLLMTIIGATTVQLGAIAFAMSNWLFPKDRRTAP